MYYDFKNRQLPAPQRGGDIDLRFATMMKDLALPLRDAHHALNATVIAGLAFVKLQCLLHATGDSAAKKMNSDASPKGPSQETLLNRLPGVYARWKFWSTGMRSRLQVQEGLDDRNRCIAVIPRPVSQRTWPFF